MSQSNEEFNPYSPPRTKLTPDKLEVPYVELPPKIWRVGPLLVIRGGINPPKRCLRCNGEASEPPYKVRITLFGSRAGKDTIDVFLCWKHQWRRSLWINLSFVVSTVPMAMFVLGTLLGHGLIAIVVMIGTVCFFPVFSVWFHLLKVSTVTRVDRSTVWLTGACQEYLDSLEAEENLGETPSAS